MPLCQEINDLPDTGMVWTLIATRTLVDNEQTKVRGLINDWISEWSSFNSHCPISYCLPIYQGQVFVWGVDTSPRSSPGISSDSISNSELDPLWRSLESFGAIQSPPFRIFPNLALLVDDGLLPMTSEMRDHWIVLAREGKITDDTILINTCSVAEWRSGRFVRRLGDGVPEIAEQLRSIGSS